MIRKLNVAFLVFFIYLTYNICSLTMGMFHYYDLSYSEVFVFDDYLINQIREGEIISPNHGFMLKEIVQKHFSKKNMVYISNRVKSYRVNPSVYIEVEKISNLLAMVIVTANKELSITAEEEFKHYHKPHKVCKNLTEAVIWVDKLIEKQK